MKDVCPSTYLIQKLILKSGYPRRSWSRSWAPETLPSQWQQFKSEATLKQVTDEVHSVADGEVINIEDVKDPVLQKYGDGLQLSPKWPISFHQAGAVFSQPNMPPFGNR